MSMEGVPPRFEKEALTGRVLCEVVIFKDTDKWIVQASALYLQK